MTEKHQITVAFSTHRPETLGFAAKQMALHDTIILEEPPVPEFLSMLEGKTAIIDYVAESETEYPEFAKASCRLFQHLHASGKRIFQVEPYIETLLNIHEHLVSGGTYNDFVPGTDQFRVYQTEKQTTQYLMNFYKTSVQGTFDQTVEAVRQFAKADARRFLLRDRMRADALELMFDASGSVYIESGEMHFALWRCLKQKNQAGINLNKLYLMGEVVHSICGKRKITGPGDQLTLRYIINPGSDSRFDSLLAARALIYNKVLTKEEMLPAKDDFPHIRDEISVIQDARRLSFDNCRRLFDSIRFMKTDDARDRLVQFLKSADGI